MFIHIKDEDVPKLLNTLHVSVLASRQVKEETQNDMELRHIFANTFFRRVVDALKVAQKAKEESEALRRRTYTPSAEEAAEYKARRDELISEICGNKATQEKPDEAPDKLEDV